MTDSNKIDEKETRYVEYIRRISSEGIPAYEPSFRGSELMYLKEVIDSGWISEGRFCRLFESSIAKYVSRTYANITSCGTAALVMGMKAIGLQEGDEVIVPTLSHSADPNSIASIGCKPVFCDIDPKTLCIDESDIIRKITPRTKAFFHVAAYGNYGNLAALEEIAKSHRIAFINDCAPALCSTYKSKPLASFGDFSILSFFSDKTITTGEGGMLLSDNSGLMEKANIYKHDGRRERGHDLIEAIGYNFRITEMQAAIGVAQFEQLSTILNKKNSVYLKYLDRMRDVKNARLFEYKIGAVPHRIIIECEDAVNLIKYLNANGVGARSLFHLMHSQPVYNLNQRFEFSEKAFVKYVCLPSAPTLTDDAIDSICSLVDGFCNEN